MNTFLSWYQQLMELSKINPVMAGIVGVWVAGVITYFMRNVPMRIWGFIKRQSMRHVDICSVSTSGHNANYGFFLDWVTESGAITFSRVLQLLWKHGKGGWDSRIEAGYGTHYFFYKRHLFWYTKSMMQQQQNTSNDLKEQVRITGLFVSDKLIRQMVEEFAHHPSKKLCNWIYRIHGGDSYAVELQPRELRTIAVDSDILNDIIRRIKIFQSPEEQERYRQQGIALKLGIEITGPSGTGKTSLIRALAYYFKRDLYVIDMSMIQSSLHLQNRLMSIDDGSFVLFEDYDSEKALWLREAYVKHLEAKGANPLDIKMASSDSIMGTRGVSLTGFLNAIDGVVPLHNLVIFYTTNVPEVIDPAVRRKGRMDVSYELAELNHKTILDFVLGIYPQAVRPEFEFAPIRGSVLSGLLLDHFDNLQAFVDTIPKTDKRVYEPIILNPEVELGNV